MTIKYHMDIEQGTPEWDNIRMGVLTASNLKRIVTPKGKIAQNDNSRSIVYELAAQRIFSYKDDNFKSEAMERGNFEELLAKNLYSDKYTQVKDCGFITQDFGGFILGYSPDGLVGDDGLIEVKSRLPKYQVETIFNNSVPDDYIMQLQGALLVSGREWIDFISYSNGMHMYVKRVFPDVEIHSAILEAAKNVSDNIRSVVEAYNKNAENFFLAERYDYNQNLNEIY